MSGAKINPLPMIFGVLGAVLYWLRRLQRPKAR